MREIFYARNRCIEVKLVCGGGGTIFCNPPYGRQLKLWVKKAYEESIKNRNTIVLLIPARTDTSYFHDYIYRKAEVRFIKGRLAFTDEDGKPQVDAKGRPMPAPFPSMLVIYNGGKKMERLTIRNTDGSVSQPTDSTFEKVFNRLAEYEDTEMTPQEIEEMKIELCDKQAILEKSKPDGEWIPARDKDTFCYAEVCSVCNYVERMNIDADANKSMPFCPNCGSCNEPPKDRSKVKTYV